MQKYEPPSGDLAEQIEKDFGSLDKLVAEFNPKTVAIQVPFSSSSYDCMPQTMHSNPSDSCRCQYSRKW